MNQAILARSFGQSDISQFFGHINRNKHTKPYIKAAGCLKKNNKKKSQVLGQKTKK